MQLERRKSFRFSTSVPVGLHFPSGPVKEGWGRIVNLSPEGLLLETRFPLKVAGVVYISLHLSNGIKFENLRTRVIRSSFEEGYYVAGIAFDEVVDQETLKNVITALAYEAGVSVG